MSTSGNFSFNISAVRGPVIFGNSANSAYVTATPTVESMFLQLARRLATAREEAIRCGRPVAEAALVVSEEEWIELRQVLKLQPQGLEPVEMWGIPVRVDWKPGTMAARRRLDKEEAVRELLAMVRELGE